MSDPTTQTIPARGWLLADDSDRERLLDMDRRLQPIRGAAFAVLAVALLLTGPWVGWWTLLPLLIAAAMFRVSDARMPRAARPERWSFAAWTGSQVTIAVSILLADAATTPLLAWLAIPVVTLSARFSIGGVVTGIAITLALLLGAAFGSDAQAVLDAPQLVVMPAALVLATGILSTALMRSDVEHRGEAVIDPLTGMLNRKALEGRVEELRQQAVVSGASVGLVVLDVDHFKRINDTIGHAAGDAALREIAYILRTELRAFELAYRIGGEEFLVLLPGADLEQTGRLAERLREAVARTRFEQGTRLTISAGTAAGSPAGRHDFEELLRVADGALYEAKRGGRNRVHRQPTDELAAV